ncbi:synaptosomal-associated protein 47 [Gracilinanus agilis]|uniref:synaptosomal-associated protein 47 n=1 Tax=Gracilinanus agilis TaxID=191870 RepID=UPI001CFE7BAC|nr:synaptosomal-associated protein 47 [Gracilinanus agilis]
MNRDICIHTWPCSYYLEPEKRWIPGKLSLTSTLLKFLADKNGELLVSLPLSSISEIKKESSHLIFSSITILEKEHLKHWFSSFQPSRNVVFNIIEHFWRELLLSQPGAQASSPQMTKGKELTGLMASSQKRLEDTAKVLHHQGEQFDNIMKGLDKIESDMDVADRLLTELEAPSWWPFSTKLWKSPSETKPKESASVPSPEAVGKSGVIIKIPAIISQSTELHAKPGKFTVFVSGLEISDSNSQLLHRFEREDVDDIKVHTPYEISIRQRFIGKPDTAYRLLSAKMPEIIQILEVQFSKKIEFLEDAMVFQSTRDSPQAEKGTSIWRAASGLIESVVHPGPSLRSGESSQIQLQMNQQVSEEEAQELRQILKKLKSIALDTETELERQDEVLDGLTSSVDRATLTIDKQNRRMKKLM